MTEPMCVLPTDLPEAILIRNALKLQLQCTPEAGRKEVRQVLAGVELHIKMALRSIPSKCNSS